MSTGPDETTPTPDDATESGAAPASEASPGPAPMPPRVSRREPYDTGETLPFESRKRGALEAPPRLSGEQQRRARRRSAVVLACAITATVVVVTLAVVGLLWVRGLEARFRLPKALAGSVEQALTTVHSAEQTYTVLALGVDADPAVQSQPVRALMLLRVTPERVTALSLAPDIAVRPQLPQSPTQVATSTASVIALGQVSEAGGFGAVIDTVERTFGVPVNHVAIVSLSALPRLADGLGGVWANVPTAVHDPAVSSLGGAARLDAGRQLLEGGKVVSLVRALPEGEPQAALMARQQLFLRGLAKALASANSTLLVPRVAAGLAGGMVSDMSSTELRTLLTRVRGSGPTIESASISGTGESAPLALDAVASARLVGAFLSGADLAKASPKAPSPAPPAAVTVTVRNGSGTSGLAAQAASILKSQGFRVREVGNADQFVYGETLVIYKNSARSGAERVAKALPVGRLVASRGMYAFDTAVLVVVGKNWQTSSPKTDPVPIEQP